MVYLQVPLVQITLACPAHPPSHGDKSRLAPNLKWIHKTGAGIEYVMPLDWLPTSAVLTYKSGVHAPKTVQFAVTALLTLEMERLMTMPPSRCSSQRQASLISVATASSTMTQCAGG
tara:strand:- start:845 stop:1195 length:351 start_codon:yes stop_codon:yes gene_type:complete